MNADVTSELAIIRTWRDAQAPSEGRDAMVAGFLWALALVAERDVTELRAQLDNRPAPVDFTVGVDRAAAPEGGPAPMAVPWPDPETAPPWPGFGVQRIVHSREAGDGPPARARAYTAGPDGRPVALTASYAEMAAAGSDGARGLLDDMEAPETGADVLADTTT